MAQVMGYRGSFTLVLPFCSVIFDDSWKFLGVLALACSVGFPGKRSAICECSEIVCPVNPVHCTADTSVSAGLLCAKCEPGSFSTDTSDCTRCPTGMLSPIGATSVQNCSAQPLYTGCFIDRESVDHGRDMPGKRLSMGRDASLEVCKSLSICCHPSSVLLKRRSNVPPMGGAGAAALTMQYRQWRQWLALHKFCQ